jgi:N-acetylglucosaminyldiphosphoundecaprenol N-acetyl-beta-D-mannosaminyltransferase
MSEQMPDEFPYETISGIKIGNFTMESLWERVKANILNEQSAVVVAINPEKIMQASRDANMKQMLSSFSYPIADGVGIVLASKLRRGCIRRRLTGVDAMEAMVDRSREIKAPLFFYGARQGVAEAAALKLQARYPGIIIAGTIDGYQKDSAIVVEAIRASKAKLVFVALGSPRQEHFMFDNREQLGSLVLQGVGGSFDVFSGLKVRAPIFFQKLGLEWLYRLICEPWRLSRQWDIIRFMFTAIIHK